MTQQSNTGDLPDGDGIGDHRYTTVDYWHPNPEYCPPGVLSVNIRVDDHELYAGDLEVRG